MLVSNMEDEKLLRYSRQIMLPEIDASGQVKLAESTVLIVGLGGLGSSASIYLTAAGIGHLILVDFDKVDLSNLQRQIVHSSEDIGRMKVDSASDHLRGRRGTRVVSEQSLLVDKDHWYYFFKIQTSI